MGDSLQLFHDRFDQQDGKKRRSVDYHSDYKQGQQDFGCGLFQTEEYHLQHGSEQPENGDQCDYHVSQGGLQHLIGVHDGDITDRQEYPDQAEIHDLHDAAIDFADGRKTLFPVEYFPEKHVKNGEGQMIDTADNKPIARTHVINHPPVE
jgi:hypothetical protein